MEGRRFPSLPSPRYFPPLKQLAHHPAPMDSFPVRHDRCEFPKAVYFTAAFGDSLAVLLHLLWVSLALLAFSQSPFPAVQGSSCDRTTAVAQPWIRAKRRHQLIWSLGGWSVLRALGTIYLPWVTGAVCSWQLVVTGIASPTALATSTDSVIEVHPS